MAKDYVSIYRQSLRMRTSNGETGSSLSRQLVNAGNGVTAGLVESHFRPCSKLVRMPKFQSEGVKICQPKSRSLQSEVHSTHWQCHRLDAGFVLIVGNVKAEFGAHRKHGGILRQQLGLERS